MDMESFREGYQKGKTKGIEEIQAEFFRLTGPKRNSFTYAEIMKITEVLWRKHQGLPHEDEDLLLQPIVINVHRPQKG